jgi:Cutinase
MMAKNPGRKSRPTSRRRRHRVLALTAAAAVALLVGLVIVIVVGLVRGPKPAPSAVPPSIVPPTSSSGQPGQPSKPRPASQDASCPDVDLISVPGTWESSAQDDPLNPAQFPKALMLSVTRPIADQFPGSRVEVYTVPYTAQFHNPMSTDNQISYNDSRAEGTRATVKALTDMNAKCPLTSYVLIGFSQGAVIAGDVASDIGNGRGPVDQDLVLGVTLIADGRREQGVGQDVGNDPPGQGAEVTLNEVPVLSELGLTMTGKRPGGFGELNNRTNEICGHGDLICAAPQEAFSIVNLPNTLNQLAGGAGQPVHALYATPEFWSSDGQPATEWTLNWARNVIENAPHPKHG